MATAKHKKFNVALWIVILCLVVFGLGVGVTVMVASTQTESIKIHNVFADINNDGKPDLILSADVVMNKGATNFLNSGGKK